MHRRLTDLNRYVRGWTGYFGLAQQFDLFDRLDGWIRRRIRMCYWKQWRRSCFRGASEDGDPARDQSQELLASFENTRNTNCDAQQMAGEPWTSFAQTTLVRPCSASRNRLVRIRMLGGVGRVTGDGGPYPIHYRFVIAVTSQKTGLWVCDLSCVFGESC